MLSAISLHSTSLNPIHPPQWEGAGLFLRASDLLNMAIMEGQGYENIFRNVLMVAAILAHTSSCFNFLLKDDICRKFRLCIDFRKNDYFKLPLINF